MTAGFPELESLPDTLVDLTDTDVPAAVLEDARLVVADTVAAAAYDDPRPTATPGGDAAGIWWSDRTDSVWEAAFTNARAAHSTDFDSVHYLTFGHPAVVVLPGLVALFESGLCSARAVLTGYTVAVEVMACLGARFGSALRSRGLHPTVVLGAPAAAAAATRALGGDADAVRHALAFASMTSIGHDVSFGSELKTLQVAVAARNALDVGMRAAGGGHTGRIRTWFDPIATLAGRVDREEPHHFGSPWAVQIVPTRVKQLPICGYYDPVLAAWRRNAPHDPAGLTGIVVEAPDYLVLADRYPDPQTMAEARFSLRYVIALLIRLGDPRPADCTPDKLADPSFRAAMSMVEVRPARDTGALLVIRGTHVTRIELRPGEGISTGWADVAAKLAGAGADRDTAAIVDAFRHFDDLEPAGWRRLVAGQERSMS